MNNQRTLVQRLWRKRARALLRAWPGIARGDENALHQARVASRRIREALPVLGLRQSTKLGKTSRGVRKITRALGPIRELDVALMVLSDHSTASTQAAVEHLRRLLLQDRAELRAGASERLARINTEKLLRRVAERIEGKAGSAATESGGASDADDRCRAIIAARVGGRAEALRTAVEWAGGVYLSDRLHAVRVAVKKLRYGLELARDAEGARPTRAIKLLKTVQDSLGGMHDLEVLIDRIRLVQGSPERLSIEAASGLDDLLRVMETETRELHASYLSRRDAVLVLCDEASLERSHALSIVSPRSARALGGGRRPRSSAADHPSRGRSNARAQQRHGLDH